MRCMVEAGSSVRELKQFLSAEGHLEIERLVLEAGVDKDAVQRQMGQRLCTLLPNTATSKL